MPSFEGEPRWEEISRGSDIMSYRLRVPGGWLYLTWPRGYPASAQRPIFVPNPPKEKNR